MSFNGSAGATFIGDAGSVGSLEPAGAYGSFPVGGVNTAGHWIITGDQGPRRLHALHIDGLALGPWSGGGIAAANAALPHMGVLVSAVPAANQHGLPVNFGPGRGGWTASDLARLLVIMCDDSATGYLNGVYQNPISAVCDEVTISGGNVTIAVYNKGKGEAGNAQTPTLHINLVWLHSVGGAEPNT